MTMSSTQAWVTHVADGTIGPYTIPFLFYAASDLEVYVDGSLASGYLVTGGHGAAGTLTFYTPPLTGHDIFLRRVTSRVQLLDYQANDAFLADSHETGLDKLTAMILDLLEELSRRPALATATAEAYRALLFPAPTASKLLGWNSAATALTLYDPAIVTVTPSAVTGLAYGKATATLHASDFAGTNLLTAAALIPAGSRVLGVTYRCTINFGTSGGLLSVTIGGMGLPDGWGSGLGITTAAVSTVGHFLRGDTPIAVSGEEVTVTSIGGTFDATGQCHVTAHYLTLTPDS